MEEFLTATLKVRILDREFSVSCPINEQEELLSAAQFLNEAMLSIRQRGRVVGSERIAITAALNITHELLLKQKKLRYDVESSRNQIQDLLAQLNASSPTLDN